MFAIDGGRFDLYHGQDATVRFMIAGGSGGAAATLFIASGPATPALDRDFVLTSGGGGLTLFNVGPDLQVDAVFTDVPDTLPTGYRHFELWVTKGGHPKPVKTGVVTVRASLVE